MQEAACYKYKESNWFCYNNDFIVPYGWIDSRIIQGIYKQDFSLLHNNWSWKSCLWWKIFGWRQQQYYGKIFQMIDFV